MSKLTELLDELCPDGVEYLPLGEVAEVLRGRRLTKKSLTDDGPYPVFHGGLDPIGYFESCNRPAHTVMVINVGASAGTVGYSAVDFWSSDGCYCLELAEGIDPRYVFQALKNQERHFFHRVRRAGIPTLDADVISRFTIPIPPLEVQQEIVRVLDAFTDLEQSLVWELELRKKQFGFHRDELLSFTANGGELCSDRVEYRLLSELGKRNKGMVITASRMKELHQEGGEVRIFAGGYTVADVDRDDLPDGAVIDKPSIIVKSRGNIGFEYHTKPFTHKNELWSYTLDDPDVDQKFIFYYLQSRVDYFQLKAKSGKLPQIGVRDTDHFSVPTPPLDMQKKIVAKLDTFQALIDSIEQEITLRRQQYEFYRDELLSFAPKED